MRVDRLLAAAAAIALFGASLAAAAQTTLRFGHANVEGEIAADLFVEFAERVGTRTDGAVTIQIFPNEQLGRENELVQQAKAGAIDITAPSMPSASLLLPALEIPSAPFLWESWEEAQAVILSDAMQPVFDELAEQHNLRPLSKILYWGWRNLTTATKPVRTPADLAGLRIRVPEQPVWIGMIQAFGASPTPVPFSEVYSALQQGVVDGQENPVPTIYTRRFFEVQDYVMVSRHMLQNNMILINTASFERLEPAHQLILLEEAQRISAMNSAVQQRREREMLEAIEADPSTTVIHDVDRAAFAELMVDAYPAMAERWGTEHFDRVVAEIERLRTR